MTVAVAVAVPVAVSRYSSHAIVAGGGFTYGSGSIDQAISNHGGTNPMMNLFDIMQAAQGGNGVKNIANQFGLSPQQATGALEALLPALSMGLQNQASSPDRLQQLAGTLMGGTANQNAFEDANGDGIPDHLQQHGNQVLGQLFGSKDVSRAVADQASIASGVSSTVLKAMLPVIASMVMGGLFKSASNQGMGGMLGQLAQGMIPGMNPGMGAGSQNQAGGLGGLLGGLLGGGQQGGGMAGGGMAGGLGGLLGSLMGGGQRQQPQQQAGFDPAAMGLEALTNMFSAGRQVQETHQSNLQGIFDAMLKR